MTQHLPNGDVSLTVLGEFRPVRGDPFVVVEVPAVGEHMGAGGGDALGRTPAHGKRVARPGIPIHAPDPTPHVEDKPAMVVDGHSGAAVGAGDLSPEDVRHLAEFFVVTTSDQICS